jgi:hypothetical protein
MQTTQTSSVERREVFLRYRKKWNRAKEVRLNLFVEKTKKQKIRRTKVQRRQLIIMTLKLLGVSIAYALLSETVMMELKKYGTEEMQLQF